MKVINEFEHEGKTMQVFEDLSVKEKPTKPEPGKHLLKDVIHLMNQGDKFTVEFTVDSVKDSMVIAIGESSGGNNAIYDDTIITIPGVTTENSDLVFAGDLSEANIGERFEIVKGAHELDVKAEGCSFELASFGRFSEDDSKARAYDWVPDYPDFDYVDNKTLLRRLS